MTTSHETTREQGRHAASPPIVRDGYRSQLGSLERETVRFGATAGPDRESRVVHDPGTRPGATGRFGSAVRILFGVIWLADVYFKWQPSFLNGLPDVMRDGTAGQPSWLMPWFRIIQSIIAVQPVIWAHCIATAETGIALALILGFARKPTYIAGVVWSLLIWTTAEGFGHVRSGIATDIGTAVIYAIVFLSLLAVDQCAGTRPYSVDAVIERRVPWWKRVAERRRTPNHMD